MATSYKVGLERKGAQMSRSIRGQGGFIGFGITLKMNITSSFPIQKNFSGKTGDFTCNSKGEEVEETSVNQSPGWTSWISNHSNKYNTSPKRKCEKFTTYFRILFIQKGSSDPLAHQSYAQTFRLLLNIREDIIITLCKLNNIFLQILLQDKYNIGVFVTVFSFHQCILS